MIAFLKVACVHCGQHIEFPGEALETVINCPHCGLSTPLRIPGVNPPPLPMAEAMPESWRATGGSTRAAAAAGHHPAGRKAAIGWLIGILISGGLLWLLWSAVPDVLPGLLVLIGAFVIYFLPAIVGRNKQNATAILILNVFLGWTVIGWVIALVWASTVESAKP